jgi:hypothetical protein
MAGHMAFRIGPDEAREIKQLFAEGKTIREVQRWFKERYDKELSVPLLSNIRRGATWVRITN